MLDAQELQRYARHIVLPEIGGAGQQRLKAAKVAVIGAGGLGTPVIQYLSAAGIGTIGIFDDDRVSISNLQRQVIHDSGNIEMLKTKSAAKAAARINPNTKIIEHSVRLTNDNADLLNKYDTVVDGSDNFPTRYLVADMCERLEKTLVSAAVSRFDGSITTLRPFDKNAKGLLNPRYTDIFPDLPEEGILPSCSEAGILGAVTGILGSLQAMETIKDITGVGECLIGRLLMFDGKSMQFDTICYKRKL